MYYCDPSGYLCKWVFPKIGVPQNGWFTMENPIQMDDLGVPLFLETPKCIFGAWCFLSQKKHLGAEIRFAQGKELVQKLKQRYKDVGRPKMCATWMSC